MKEINLPSGNYLFIEIPDNVKDFEVNHSHHATWVLYDYISKRGSNSIKISEDVINYEIISTTNDITEEQCSLICEKGIKTIKAKPNFDPEWERDIYKEMYMGYAVDNSNKLTKLPVHVSAKKSLKSLMQANNLNIQNNYLILKKL